MKPTQPPPVIDATERRWRNTSAPGRCDDALTTVCLDIGPLLPCSDGSPSGATANDRRYALLARQVRCGNGDAPELYVAGHRVGEPGTINGHLIGARLIWDARLRRDCYFLWVWCDEPGNVIWEGCRRAITPIGKYGVHRHGNICLSNTGVVHLAIT